MINQIIPERRSLTLDEFCELLDQEYRHPQVFDAEVVGFLSDLSRAVLRDRDLQRIPEVVAFAYWIRKASVEQIIEEHRYLTEGVTFTVRPIGKVFHICPSNVDTMFLYSVVVSLLMGNSNVVRVSSRLNQSYINIIFDLIQELLQSHYPELAPMFRVVSYERNDEVNTAISLRSDARVIWGGDETVRSFRRIESNVRCRDLVFADRESMSVVNASFWVHASESDRAVFIKNFYNDTYSFDQKGCSCPQRIFLIGDPELCGIAETGIYNGLLNQARNTYENDVASLVSLKWNAMSNDAISGKVSDIVHEGTELVFARIPPEQPVGETCGAGYVYVSVIETFEQLTMAISGRTQTLTHWGFSHEQIRDLEIMIAEKGVDRMVPVGKALEFGYVWDGYDLLDELCVKRKLIF